MVAIQLSKLDREIADVGVNPAGESELSSSRAQRRWWTIVLIVVLCVVGIVVLVLGLTGQFEGGGRKATGTGLSEPPANVSAKVVGKNVDVSFTAPPTPDGGGAPVTSFTVLANPGGLRATGGVVPQDEVFVLADGSRRWNVDDVVTSTSEPSFASTLSSTVGSRFTLRRSASRASGISGTPIKTNDRVRIHWEDRTVRVGSLGEPIALSEPNALDLAADEFVFEGDVPAAQSILTASSTPATTFRIKSADGSVYLGKGLGATATELLYTSQAQASTFTIGEPVVGVVQPTKVPQPPRVLLAARAVAFFDPFLPPHPITVRGLDKRVPYTFTVASSNSEGLGAFSDVSSNEIVLLTPLAPTGVEAVQIVAGRVQVTFVAPVNGGDAIITGYTVRAIVVASTADGLPTSAPPSAVAVVGNVTVALFTTEVGNATLVEATDPVTGRTFRKVVGPAVGDPEPVAGLTSGETYAFAVTATNAHGTGAESVQSAPMTPIFT
jgi:hypothetical protein